MPKPRPIIIIDTRIIGGPGRGLLQLIDFLESRSVSYLLCTFQYPNENGTEFSRELSSRNANFVQLRQRFRFDPGPLYDFFSIARRGSYNLLQSHGYKSHLIAAVTSRLLSLPWVAFAHGWTSEDLKVKFYHRIDRVVLRFANSLVTVSPHLTQIFREIRPSKHTEEIFNAVDPSSIPGLKGGEAVRDELRVRPEELLIGCFGRLSHEKGQDILLEAFDRASNRLPNLKLLILGDGPDRPKLQSTSKNLGIFEKVIFEQHTRNIRDYYEAIDLLVIPSRSEGMPNVALEAMSFSVPVIGTDVGAASGYHSQ